MVKFLLHSCLFNLSSFLYNNYYVINACAYNPAILISTAREDCTSMSGENRYFCLPHMTSWLNGSQWYDVKNTVDYKNCDQYL